MELPSRRRERNVKNIEVSIIYYIYIGTLIGKFLLIYLVALIKYRSYKSNKNINLNVLMWGKKSIYSKEEINSNSKYIDYLCYFIVGILLWAYIIPSVLVIDVAWDTKWEEIFLYTSNLPETMISLLITLMAFMGILWMLNKEKYMLYSMEDLINETKIKQKLKVLISYNVICYVCWLLNILFENIFSRESLVILNITMLLISAQFFWVFFKVLSVFIEMIFDTTYEKRMLNQLYMEFNYMSIRDTLKINTDLKRKSSFIELLNEVYKRKEKYNVIKFDVIKYDSLTANEIKDVKDKKLKLYFVKYFIKVHLLGLLVFNLYLILMSILSENISFNKVLFMIIVATSITTIVLAFSLLNKWIFISLINYYFGLKGFIFKGKSWYNTLILSDTKFPISKSRKFLYIKAHLNLFGFLKLIFDEKNKLEVIEKKRIYRDIITKYKEYVLNNGYKDRFSTSVISIMLKYIYFSKINSDDKAGNKEVEKLVVEDRTQKIMAKKFVKAIIYFFEGEIDEKNNEKVKFKANVLEQFFQKYM